MTNKYRDTGANNQRDAAAAIDRRGVNPRVQQVLDRLAGNAKPEPQKLNYKRGK